MNEERIQRILQQRDVLGEDVLNMIPIIECNEPILDISMSNPDVIIQMSKARLEYAGSNVLYARKSVCEMISQVTKSILPNYKLLLFDAYRPIEYQRLRFNQVFHSIKSKYPDQTDDFVRKLAFEVVFPPNDDPQQPPPHATGAAVDVALTTQEGKLLDFGSAYGIYNDDENRKHYTNSKFISNDQRDNRTILIRAMVSAGFSNYPGEWWHYMYGDREYAAYEGLTFAKYGRADLLK